SHSHNHSHSHTHTHKHSTSHSHTHTNGILTKAAHPVDFIYQVHTHTHTHTNTLSHTHTHSPDRRNSAERVAPQSNLQPSMAPPKSAVHLDTSLSPSQRCSIALAGRWGAHGEVGAGVMRSCLWGAC